MTKRKALEICIELWTWLAKSGSHKNRWPRWEWNGGEIKWMQNQCSLCEYSDREKKGCEACPLKEALDRCKPNSVYAKWCASDLKIFRKWYARKIRNYAIKALKDLKSNETN